MSDAEEHIVFLTGRLAADALRRELQGLRPRRFSYDVVDIGVKVAALMNATLIRRRLRADQLDGASRVLVPGLCTGRVESLGDVFGVPFERGPKDLKDLADHFGARGRQVDLSQYRVKIFAEIVDAPDLDVDAIVARAERYRRDGADVIDLGCLPDTPFPHLEDAVAALRERGVAVSVDSLDSDDLLRGGRAGADYLLSLKESTLWIADRVAATPVLIPEQSGDLDSLQRACDALTTRGRAFYADPILEPIHFGFVDSLARYRELRRRLPAVDILMGVGNLTELTDADSAGVNALLFGAISELDVGAVLTTEVSPHCASAVREADLARRVMRAARDDGRLPRGYHDGLLALRARKPFPYRADEIAADAAAVRDANFRVRVSADGLHVYNQRGHWRARDPFDLYPQLDEIHDDAAHAFYLGVELARAQIAWQLGKRYLQDNELEWGCATEPARDDLDAGYRAPASTKRR